MLEYIEGAPLRGPLRADEAVRLAVQIADALEAAHQRGILHRDLKPANILVTTARPLEAARLRPGEAHRSADVDGMTSRGRSRAPSSGTAAYMSPEQAEGKPLDARSDIFSFGAVLYEMLSGTRAFAGDTAARSLSAVLRDDPPPLAAPPPLTHRRPVPGEAPRRTLPDDARAAARRSKSVTASKADAAAVDRRAAVREHERATRRTSTSATAWPKRSSTR